MIHPYTGYCQYCEQIETAHCDFDQGKGDIYGSLHIIQYKCYDGSYFVHYRGTLDMSAVSYKFMIIV